MSKNATVKTTAKAALTQMINIINQRMEMHVDEISHGTNVKSFSEHSDDKNGSGEQLENEEGEMNGEKFSVSQSFDSIFHRDSYLVFRALCKLSMKGVAEEQAQQDSNVTYQNK